MHFDAQFWINNGVHVVAGVLILVIAHIVGKAAEMTILKRTAKENNKQQQFAIIMLAHITYFTILFIGFMIILRVFGLEIASIIAVVSAIGFAVGLSLQGSLSDIASGILITFFKIFNIGDVIQINETEGKVLDFKLIHTVIEELNTKSIMTVPNRTLQGSLIGNITKKGYHYFIVDMLVSNKNKNFAGILDMLRKELKDAKKFPDVIQNMPHRVSVADMSGVGTKLRIRVPITTAPKDVAVARGDIRNALRSVLENNGIILMDPTAIVSA